MAITAMPRSNDAARHCLPQRSAPPSVTLTGLNRDLLEDRITQALARPTLR
jgi:hypothetical protein